MRSSDGRSALVTFAMTGDRTEAVDRVDEVETAVAGVAAAHPGSS
jgi:hypothetical protein